MKTYIVDRIESGRMILENEEEQFFEIPKELLPEAKEGDCVSLYVNKEETEKRRAKMRALLDSLFED